ncbi:hypothetical protein J0X15_08255 [Roseibium sp. CAU 1637]|uniref:Uncharacterized protein n=1 Tax=Roseibium limicola TaxID=2816037 RepID=A0A939EMC1_9HYPH|nr:hypothetical protein [Roseibium limicola]MBO0345209.1 hypothetical protein [Roseibium limicola]
MGKRAGGPSDGCLPDASQTDGMQADANLTEASQTVPGPGENPCPRPPVKLNPLLVDAVVQRMGRLAEQAGREPPSRAEVEAEMRRRMEAKRARRKGGRKVGWRKYPAKDDDPSAALAQGEHLSLQDPQARAAMIARLYRSFAAQMERMESRLKALETQRLATSGTQAEAGVADIGEIDRTVKTLASLARTLTVLLGLQAEAERDAGMPAKAKGARGHAEVPGQRDSRVEGSDDTDADGRGSENGLDPDTLRRTLAQRLERLCGAGPAGGRAEPADPDGNALSAE